MGERGSIVARMKSGMFGAENLIPGLHPGYMDAGDRATQDAETEGWEEGGHCASLAKAPLPSPLPQAGEGVAPYVAGA